MLPEGSHHRVLYFRHFVAHEFFIHENAGHINKRGSFIRVFHKGQTRITKIVLNSRSENFITEYFNEDFRSLAGRHILLFRGIGFKHIESHWPLNVGRIENNHILDPFFGHILEEVFNQVTMRINHTDPIAILNVLTSHETEERGFTCSRLSNDVVVASSISLSKMDFMLHSTIGVVTQQYTFIGHIGGRR